MVFVKYDQKGYKWRTCNIPYTNSIQTHSFHLSNLYIKCLYLILKLSLILKKKKQQLELVLLAVLHSLQRIGKLTMTN